MPEPDRSISRIPLMFFHQCAVLILLFLMPFAGSAKEVDLDASKIHIALGEESLAYFRDPTGQISPENALAEFQAGSFTLVSGNLALGFVKDAVWLASKLNRAEGSPDKWVLRLEPPTLDLVELYQFNDNHWKKQVSGDGVPVSLRSHFHRSPTFELTLPAGTTFLLMRIKSTSQVTAIPFLSKVSAFEQTNMTETLVLGLYFGALMIVLVYNLVIAFSVRQSLYFLYCVLVITHMLFWLSFDGLLGLYVFSERPILANLVLGSLVGISSFVGVYFWAQALGVVSEYKVSRVFLLGIKLIAVGSVLSVFIGEFPMLMPWLLGSLVFSVMVLGSHAMRNLLMRGQIDRQIFGLAYLMYGATVLITVLMNLSILPANLWTAYSAQIGQFIPMIALHLGLYFRVRKNEQLRLAVQIQYDEANRMVELERNARREQDQLLHLIGHEVRTPIAIISSAIDSLKLIEEQSIIDPLKEQRYQRISKAIKRMEMLMQLVGLEQNSRLDIADSPRLEQVNLRELCLDNLDLLVDAGNRISFDVALDLNPKIQGDYGLLGFLLLNLYDNALKYAVGQEPIQAGLQLESRGNRQGVCFTICNSARPFAPGFTERIFEKYMRIDEHHSQPGLGLGLYLARRIAQQHNGTLIARNSGPLKICFVLWLPLDEAYKT